MCFESTSTEDYTISNLENLVLSMQIMGFKLGYILMCLEHYIYLNLPTIISGAKLQGANLKKAELSGADLSASLMKGTNLQDTQLAVATLNEADLTDCAFDGANLPGAQIDANMKGAKETT